MDLVDGCLLDVRVVVEADHVSLVVNGAGVPGDGQSRIASRGWTREGVKFMPDGKPNVAGCV